MSDTQARTTRSTPESLRLKAISPGLTVNDIQASLAWYTDVLGFTLKDRWEMEGELRGVELVAGNAHLMLGQDDGAKGWDRVKGQGFRLYLTTAQDVDELAEGIKSRGGSLETEPQDSPWGRHFSVVDPDGFAITFSHVE